MFLMDGGIIYKYLYYIACSCITMYYNRKQGIVLLYKGMLSSNIKKRELFIFLLHL